MEILDNNKKNLEKIVAEIKSGGVVSIPTETLYGLSADPRDNKAVNLVYKIKGREFKNPLLLIADDFNTVKKFFKINKIEEKLMKKYWPGALTFLLKSKANLKISQKCVKHGKIAVRVSGDKLARKIAKESGGLIVSTSANISGQPACSSVSAIKKQLKNQNIKVLDGGRLKKSLPSTIVEVLKNGEVKILRQGKIVI